MLKVKELHIRWIGIIVLSLALTFLLKNPLHEKQSFLKNFLITFAFSAVFWNGCHYIILTYRRKYPNISQTVKRLAFTFLLISVLLILGANIVRVAVGINTVSELQSLAIFFSYVEVNFICAILISSIYESVYFFSKWTKSVKQNEALKTQQMKTQFEVLQNQMSPHFLFNSLNTLTTLIAESQELAINFTQELAEVYRYILHNKEKELLELKEELKFAKSYVYLLKIRYPNNLNVKFSIDPKYENYYIAPLTLQILIENAIKHNIVSKLEPLQIKVYISNDAIIVSNNLQIKSTIEKSTKTGLENIKKRYALLGNRIINVLESKNLFLVSVPLIKVITEFDYLREDKA